MATESRVGTKIKKRRQALGLKQSELAERVGVDRTTVSNWETGKQRPERYLGALERELGVSLDGVAEVSRDQLAGLEDQLRATARKVREAQDNGSIPDDITKIRTDLEEMAASLRDPGTPGGATAEAGEERAG